MENTIENQIFDILYAGKLAWTCNKEQLYTKDGTIATNGYCTRRSDTGDILGIVGSRYMPLQNQQLVQEFIEATKEFGLVDISGISVDGGKKVVLKAKIGDIQIGTDTVHRYITVSNTHDGSGQVRLGIYNKVLVCSNGMMREISSNELAKVKHTTNAGEKMNWYIRNIPKVIAAEEEMMRNYEVLAQVKVNQKHIQTLIDTIYKVDTNLPADEVSKRKQNQVKEFDKTMTSNGLNVHGATLWGLLQTQTFLSSHDKTGTSNEAKLMSGVAYEKSQLTYALLMDMVNNPIYDLVDEPYQLA